MTAGKIAPAGHSRMDSILGLDIGSVTISLVEMDLSGKILRTFYLYHHGQVRELLRQAGRKIDLTSVSGIYCCSSSRLDPGVVRMFDPQVAAIRAASTMFRSVRTLLVIGAEKFHVIRFNEQGSFESIRSNSSCAAGTGSFLDQQAFRLNLSGIGEFCETALRNNGPTPDIASRCSVFAKTDLIHAQQRGFSLESICDSLCKGLAKNIVDTLFNQENPEAPVFIGGGVSQNQAVIRHLEQQLDVHLHRHEHSHLTGALGACYLGMDEFRAQETRPVGFLDQILLPDDMRKSYFHPPLELRLSDYPDFSCPDSWDYSPRVSSHPVVVSVDLYRQLNNQEATDLFLGIDIGSTSTKAILIDTGGFPAAGFYTYTSGKPLEAVQLLLEAIDDLFRRYKVNVRIIAAGTTGSGRTFIGKILHADLIVDEITTHARAARELNPATDTIIEIGGQDSKFTLMQDGMVTFSQMNSVCAAGTGSFIEEQARKLGCSLSDYAGRTEGISAPLASDRCTVFMERDTNHLLNQGYSATEILATTLHSVMENYLKKVGVEGAIGDHVCFQGATARNKSLVAAFEQRIGKKIFVSPYCHLTGALGVALMLMEDPPGNTTFRGIGLFREKIAIHSETCTLCANHCNISLTVVRGEEEAYGFLCGRDYTAKKREDPPPAVFNLLKERAGMIPAARKQSLTCTPVIGIPATLHIYEEMVLWKRFFENLALRVITSENCLDPVKAGKRIAGAEFCSPIDSLYGHVEYLVSKADYIFLPVSFETRNKETGSERYFCYYTQFSASLVSSLKDKKIREKLISPLLDFSKGGRQVVRKLHQSLFPFFGSTLPLARIKAAYEEAVQFSENHGNRMHALFRKSFRPDRPVSVLLLGRPYIVLSRSMNKGIPDILARMGIDAFYQDMVHPYEISSAENQVLLRNIPWHFAASIMETARLATSTPNLYPVLVTAFKCAPDAFIIDCFRKLMNSYRKPYLILQIDDHDSNVGYETRIEAAIRSFRNHSSMSPPVPDMKSISLFPHLETSINGRTLLFPNWDNIVAPLLVANLKRSGIDARLLRPSDISIRKSMAYNTGQCLPVNIMTQEFIDYVESHDLKPENTMLWMVKCFITCNLRLYPFHIKNLLEAYGKGFEKAAVYSGQLTHLEIAIGTSYQAYFAYLLGGLIRKTGCRIRPYEQVRGETDRVIEESTSILEPAFLGNRSMDDAVRDVLKLFDGIGRIEGKRPGVAIFGDLYVRDNDIMNQELIHTIEECGGEAITTPYTDLVKITIENVIRRALARGDYFESGLYRVMLSSIKIIEDKYYRLFRKYLGPKPVVNPLRLERHLEKFNITQWHSGESFENILKIFYILENYPGVALFVQTNPAFCCPALVTEAMTREIMRVTGVPVVTLTYDGTGENRNDLIRPFLLQTRETVVK